MLNYLVQRIAITMVGREVGAAAERDVTLIHLGFGGGLKVQDSGK